ncbi:hypothetical protein [Sulfobacillus harzensis]|uniref:hypothetical protein n=1 Tax=Sulfobacillus harzensis TaxID=2729629 RepID=UPI001A9AA652|nr:hypothetical protein [Sulfobacillus harzensis]
MTTAYIAMGSANVIAGIGSVVHLFGTTGEDLVMGTGRGMKVAMGENPIRVYSGQHRRPTSRPGIAAVLREWLERARRYQAYPPEKLSEYNPRLEALGLVLRGDIPLRIPSHRAGEMLTALRLSLGAPGYALKAVTAHPVAILGNSGPAGIHWDGQEVDLVLWSDNPLAGLQARTLSVWIRGQVVQQA